MVGEYVLGEIGSDLKQLIDKRARATVKYTKENSPYYNQLFKEEGIDLDDIQTVEDLRKIPVTTSEDIRENQPLNFKKGEIKITGESNPFIAIDQEDIRLYFMSSGSTGAPKIFTKTEDDISKAIEVGKRSYRRAGISSKDTVLDAYPMFINASGHMSYQTLREMGAGIVRIGTNPDPPKSLLTKISPVSTFLSSPSQAKKFLYSLEKKGIQPEATGIDKIQCAGERFPSKLRKLLANEFEAEVTNSYATTEFSWLAASCEESPDNLHLYTDRIWASLRDPDNPERTREKKGLAVFTPLIKPGEELAMPLINYSLGDILTIEEESSCGSPFPIIKDIHRAKNDKAVGGAMVNFNKMLPKILLQESYREAGATGDYQIFLEDKNGKEKLTVQLETIDKNKELLNKFKRDLGKIHWELKDVIRSGKLDLEVILKEKGNLERSPGKPKRVVDKRKRN